MAKKILLFESDAAFATELSGGFQKLGATVNIVDDGNAGLERAKEDRPDLILLCIELPRMNGFSVCNKLKKNSDLKDIPLVIMSSEATEETFEQHRKLRTRAEDYIRKPFSFGELMEKVSALVTFDGAGSSDGDDEPIAIDEEIAIDDLVSLDEGGEPVAEEAPAENANVDAEVDAFADQAFDALMMGDSQPAAKKTPPPSATEDLDEDTQLKPVPTRERVATPAPRERKKTPVPRDRMQTPAPTPPPPPAAEPPAPSGPSAAEVAALHEELEELREKAAQVDTLRRAAAEGDRLKTEVEELKKKVAKSGGPSSREFLDLREQLNKKDKEILDLKDAVNHRDKQILDVRDRLTAVEREKADMEEKYEETSQLYGESKDRIVGLEQDKETVTKRVQDLQGRVERAQAETDKAYRELEEQKKRRDQIAQEKDAAVAAAEAKHAQAMEAIVEKKDSELLAALERLEAERLKAKADALGGLQRQHQEELGRLQREHAAAISTQQAQAAQQLEEADERRKTELRLADDAQKEALAAAAETASAALAQREKELVAKADAEMRGSTDRHGREMAVLGGKLADAEDKIVALAKELADERESHLATAGKLAEREKEGAAAKGDLDRTRAALEEANGRLASLREEHAALEERNATNEERALRAMTRIRDDAAVIEKAKKALAIGLALLDEQSEKHESDS